KVSLDRVLGHEEALSYFAVGHSLGGHTSDAQFRGREGVTTFGGVPARARTCRNELVVRARRDGVRTAGTGQLERLAQRLACVGASSDAAGCRPELEQRDRVLESPRRLLEPGDGLLEQLDPGLSRFDEAKRAQRNAERARCPEGAAALEFLTRQRTGLVL